MEKNDLDSVCGKIHNATSSKNKARKTDPSKLTSLKSLKGAFESKKMLHFTNKDDKNKWNEHYYRHEKLESKLKLVMPVSSQKPTPKGAQMLVNFVYYCINFL